MRNGGIQSAGHKFDYNPSTTYNQSTTKNNPIKKVLKNLGNFLAQGITNQQDTDRVNNASAAFRS